MSDRKPFLLRLDERTFLALKRWADDELRSINGQVEFLLRRSLEQAGRLDREVKGRKGESPDGNTQTGPDPQV